MDKKIETMDQHPLAAYFQQLLDRADTLLERLEAVLPPLPQPEDQQAQAYRWRKPHDHGYLEAVRHPDRIQLSDLQNIEPQKDRLLTNTQQFVTDRLANNVLLTGARGCGKSSLVKAVWNEFRADGLKLIEVEKTHLVDLPDIVALIADRPERYLIFCDDLSFEEGDWGYQALKTALDGSIAAPSANVLIYATSNRRHLLPEYHGENRQTRHVDGEIHPGEATEEKIALSERFGLWLSFYGFSQSEYLIACQYWNDKLGGGTWDDTAERTALQWAQGRGARNGRVAWQFARDWVGQAPSRQD